MKSINIFTIMIVSLFILNSCKTTKETTDSVLSISLDQTSDQPSMKVNFIKGNGFNHPTFVLWMEDLSGNYLKTIYITQSFAKGIFGHEMVGDTVWKKTSGPSVQPAALPYWVHKKGPIDGKNLLPTQKHPFLDAYSGATPTQDFELKTTIKTNSSYRLMLEVNQPWDWNEYWTNNKYPGNNAYSHSAQPSVIYYVEINKDSDTFFMNPIGHGNPKGEDGKLYTDISTLSTAKEIFKEIKIEFITNE